ncbi:MAG: hypothetical protein PHQ52_08130 [Candidatus Omnitrophica bacterium]|nr:hypothetical protein [Candidatus Omnitrophota bacterium]
MKKNIFRTFLTFYFLLFTFSLAYANNLTIENVEIVSKDTANKTSTIQFDISWENSWRGSINYDAAWVFIKYKLNSDGNWYHANLKTAGTNPADVDRGTGTEIDIVVSSDKVGAFIQRSNTGAGTTSVDDVELVWDWDASGLDADAVIDEIKVFGIEMTYIPQGSFYLGDTQSDYGQFEAGTTGAVFQITGEGALTLGGGGAGSLGDQNGGFFMFPDDFNDTTTQTLPANFPKGYEAFYCMKYEISQGQYRDFLNTLTRDQQNKRTYTDVSTDAITNTYVMANNSSMQYRNGIRCPATGNGTTEPITFGCDYNGASTFDESTDGEWIACNYLSWMDGCPQAETLRK